MEHLRQQYRRIMGICLALGFVLTALALFFDLFGMQTALVRAPHAAIVALLMATICGSALACVSFGFVLIEQGMAEQARLRAKRDCEICISALAGQNPWAAAVLEDEFQQVVRQERL